MANKQAWVSRFVGDVIVHKFIPLAELKEPMAEVELANELLKLTEEQRMKVFKYFCVSCGSSNNLCQCQNNE